MPRFHHCTVPALFLALAFGHAEAGSFSVTYSGATAAGSTLEGGVPITLGTPFTIVAAADDRPYTTYDTGIAFYRLISLGVDIGGTHFSVFFDTYTFLGYGLELFDATNPRFPGFDIPGLYRYGFHSSDSGLALAPVYSSATPPFDALHPASTVFRGYLGSVASAALFLPTQSGGDFDFPSVGVWLTYDPAVGVDASIDVIPIIPEMDAASGTGALALLAGALGLASERRRKNAAV